MAAEFVCELCWFSFPTQEELNQHIALEETVTWTVGDYEPSTKAEPRQEQFCRGRNTCARFSRAVSAEISSESARSGGEAS